MAKPATLQIKLVSTADTGFYYVTKKNPRTKPEKLELKKYDPKARKHVLFREAKIKQGLKKAIAREMYHPAQPTCKQYRCHH